MAVTAVCSAMSPSNAALLPAIQGQLGDDDGAAPLLPDRGEVRRETELLHHATRRLVLGLVDADDAVKPALGEAPVDGGLPDFGGQAAAPPWFGQAPPDLD